MYIRKQLPGYIGLLWILFSFSGIVHLHAQIKETETDSIVPMILDEVVLISGKRGDEEPAVAKPLGMLDEYLLQSDKVSMIRRGAYAWEPMLNDMTSERLAISIDGMRIFAACTDKMDPVTSYVEVANLKTASIHSGQGGALYGNALGGAIDLATENAGFNSGQELSLTSGYEFNNRSRILGASGKFSKRKFYIDSDIFYRHADNYTDGKGETIDFTQYSKLNFSVNTGVKLTENSLLKTSMIYDRATDVGYAALPMDVSLAEALISGLTYSRSEFWKLNDFEAKLYFNTITHIMDDSNREDVAIRMDMPGKSTTTGAYAQGHVRNQQHDLLIKWDAFYNRSFAEMTMFSNNSEQPDMYMVTWPDVHTFNQGLYAEDHLDLRNMQLMVSARAGMQSFSVKDDFGRKSLQIFYPELEKEQLRFLMNTRLALKRTVGSWRWNFGVGYGNRAPSVSEGFGFYLFNSFDNHDYIGNPNLKNESALEISGGWRFQRTNFMVGLTANYFYMFNYILGITDPDLDVMTFGAEGVRVYQNINNVQLFNTTVNLEYQIFKDIRVSGNIAWHSGTIAKGESLPFISPLTYVCRFHYDNRFADVSIDFQGAAPQVNYNGDFGEDRTPSYSLLSLSIGKQLSLFDQPVYVKGGVENVFDESYTTFSDWNNIPRMGRNVFFSLKYTIN
ncbi:TonB-dependent receptor plug domain-containing protein [Robertkochia solimangrovi]|uniref:TonB-dependent receptor plug domain-containing protein n=1 Tax=Robertkochia solimangrovi TaxID=2213046 RepID=UPI00117F7D70|nr:TonB-dependent receptor [Robertkochia solimangrovi]TRZ42921.1 TonB-dependent receptor [Robertkochia solimangrovi]